MAHDIAGLIAWAKREEWRGALAELLDRHSAQACTGAGIEIQNIADILGDDVTAVLFGTAFEDLVATDFPGGRNVADDYLRRRGWKESASARDYIAGLRRSVISFYEVSGLVPGKSMQLRDLVRGGEPVRVSAKLGSQGLRQWDRVATRVIPLREGAVIGGTLGRFEHEVSEALLAEGDDIRRFGKGSTHTTIYVPEIRAHHICLPPLAKQLEIVRARDKALPSTASAAHDATSTVALLDRLKRSILSRAFRGALVRPDDEVEASKWQMSPSRSAQDQKPGLHA